MQKIIDYSSDDVFFPGGYVYPNPKESNPFWSLGRHVDVYFPSRKRSRVNAPFVFSGERFKQKQQPSIEVLPDECLFEVFRRLAGSQQRSACASVSKRWLKLLSTIRRDEICSTKSTQSLVPEEKLIYKKVVEKSDPEKKGEDFCSDDNEVVVEDKDQDIDGDGYLSRCLEGNKATDVRLAAMAVGTCVRGGLGKLSVRGNNSSRGVTNIGLKAIARGCPSLRVLSLWNLNSIGDEGLIEIANGCQLLEKLDLCQCPAISDKALVAIAKNCRNLTSMTIESCMGIGNESLQTIGRLCPNLKSISIKNCHRVGDQGIASLLSSAGNILMKLKLQYLNVGDMSLALIGHYGKAITDLVLIGLQMVSEKGFWVMGSAQGLQNLRTLAVTSCQGVTDVGLEAVGRGCPNLKQFFLQRCSILSDSGLVSFVKVAESLENLQLEECHRITQSGIFGIFVNCGKLKALGLANCLGIKDLALGFPLISPCRSLRSLSVCNCPGFGDASLAIFGRLCPNLMHINLSGLCGITDTGVLLLIESSEDGLVKVNLGGCVNMTDKVISTIAKLHGETLEVLNLDSCRRVTDASLVAIAKNCSLLSELHVSKCAITDSGIAVLASAVQFSLKILSLFGCSLVSDKSVPILWKLGQTLIGLNIQHCHGISSSMVDLIVEQLWRCDILY